MEAEEALRNRDRLSPDQVKRAAEIAGLKPKEVSQLWGEAVIHEQQRKKKR